MIVYGTNWSNKKIIPTREICPICGVMHSVSLIYQYEYAHIYGISLFPIKKDIRGYCQACEEGINYQSIKTNTTQHSVRYPILSFVGLILIVLAITVFASYIYIDKKQTRELSIQCINTPEVGDIYEVKFSEKEYGLMRISDIKGDSILMQLGEYVTDRITGLKELKNGEYKDRFYDETFSYTKDELFSNLEQEVIIRVNRKTQ
ncbi:hypothetical protein [Dysgonomonas macrotermitis]|uniref:Zinc-ribbon 15 domain-containing protein n=1 Tax=Dysgonomonas macrotermitis TaxID=1346286 RepID=A0A1M5BKZ2_9BACT|nr:hypothetical protein [Dysgonomonas macrotermitis]SHF43224.1 hypothetical protein SAMN05444362_106109 [Dysgonomonas macrotermitis]